MNQHAVQMIWTMDIQNFSQADQDKQFDQQVLPSVRALPGFVTGMWVRSTDGTRAYNTVVFNDRTQAESFVGHVQGTAASASAAGVHLHSMEVLDVIGVG